MKGNYSIILFSMLCLTFMSVNMQAQQQSIPGTTAEKQTAIDRYNQVHSTAITVNQLPNYLQATQQNLDNWRAVLDGFTEQERFNKTGAEGFAHDKTHTSNADYRYISYFVAIIERQL